MRYLRRIGALFSEGTWGYWRAVYIFLLVVWATYIMWQVASGSLLETPDASPTLIKIGLLEAVAFLAAWSLLLITVTTKVVNTSRDLELTLHKSSMELRRHEENHPDVQSEVERIEVEISEMTERMMQVDIETEKLVRENERLRRILEARATKELRND